MKKFMTRKHTEEHLSSRKDRFSDLMGKGLFLLAFSSALSTNIWAQTTTTTNAQTTSQNFTGKVCDSKDGSSLIGCNFHWHLQPLQMPMEITASQPSLGTF